MINISKKGSFCREKMQNANGITESVVSVEPMDSKNSIETFSYLEERY